MNVTSGLKLLGITDPISNETATSDWDCYGGLGLFNVIAVRMRV